MQRSYSPSPPQSPAELSQHAAAVFAERFGRGPQWLVAAPGRVNLIDEHVDYNDGLVLPMAIERWTVLAAGPAQEPNCIRLWSDDLDEAAEFTLPTSASPAHINPPSSDRCWSNYVRGVVAGCIGSQIEFPAFDAVIASSVPIGGGLSSSAALEVATATLIEAMSGRQLEIAAKALVCQRAEHDFAGVPCGIMDQFVVAGARCDHLMLLDCRSLRFELIPLVDPELSLLIINSQVSHSLSGGEYAQRRAQCEAAARTLGVAKLRDATLADLERHAAALEATLVRRARHVITEIARTAAAAEAVARHDWPALGAAMYASHASLRDDYEVSCRELDLLVDLAREIGVAGGVIGSRMTGGGFGGCTATLVRTAAVEKVSETIRIRYNEATGIEPTMFATRPAAGAAVLEAPPTARSPQVAVRPVSPAAR
jgi:galactokinase